MLNNVVVIPQPNAAAAPVPQLPSSQSSDAISVHSATSTDWEEAYGMTVTPPPLDISTVSDADVPSVILPCEDKMCSSPELNSFFHSCQFGTGSC